MLTRAKAALVRRLGISRLAEQHATLCAELDSVRGDLAAVQSELQRTVDDLRHAHADLVDRAKRSDRWNDVQATSLLFARLVAPRTPISVVMATRDRPELCRRAVLSVIAQRHPEWQLLVVDDGSTDGTSRVLDDLADTRIVRLHSGGVGAAAARNLAIEAATGDWVTFLDDDNVMDEGWLHAIAVLGGHRPDVVATYGAQLRQHEAGDGHDGLAASLLFADDAQLGGLLHDNVIDLGAVAVRRSSHELYLHADLHRFIDWDFVVRLHHAHGLHPLPVWSGVYTTDAGDRISSRGGDDAIETFRRRLADPADPVGRPGCRPGAERP